MLYEVITGIEGVVLDAHDGAEVARSRRPRLQRGQVAADHVVALRARFRVPGDRRRERGAGHRLSPAPPALRHRRAGAADRRPRHERRGPRAARGMNGGSMDTLLSVSDLQVAFDTRNNFV